MNKYGDDFVGVFGRNQFACAETEYARCMRSFPTSFHGSLILADARLAFKLILDKVRNNKKTSHDTAINFAHFTSILQTQASSPAAG